MSRPPNERGCPCEWVKPCRAECSCANSVMSGGCDRCCKYGSTEQRLAAAKSIAALLDEAYEKDRTRAVWMDEIERLRRATGELIGQAEIVNLQCLEELHRWEKDNPFYFVCPDDWQGEELSECEKVKAKPPVAGEGVYYRSGGALKPWGRR